MSESEAWKKYFTHFSVWKQTAHPWSQNISAPPKLSSPPISIKWYNKKCSNLVIKTSIAFHKCVKYNCLPLDDPSLNDQT